MSRLVKVSGIQEVQSDISTTSQTPITKEQVNLLKEFNKMLNRLSDECMDDNFNNVMGQMQIFTASIDEIAAELSELTEIMDFFQ